MAYNPQDATQRQKLLSEITTRLTAQQRTDLGDQGIANEINKPTAGTAPRGVRPSMEVMNCIDGAAFIALAAGPRDYLIALVSPGSVDLGNDVVRTSLSAAFPAGTPSRDRLIALADKPNASLGEQWFGVGTVITASNVAGVLRPEPS